VCASGSLNSWNGRNDERLIEICGIGEAAVTHGRLAGRARRAHDCCSASNEGRRHRQPDPARRCLRRSRTEAAAAGVGLDGIEIVNPKESDRLDEYTAAYVEGRDLNPEGRHAYGQATALLRGHDGCQGRCRHDGGGSGHAHGPGHPGRRPHGRAGGGNRHAVEFLPDDHPRIFRARSRSRSSTRTVR
jgi:hypothetical protein